MAPTMALEDMLPITASCSQSLVAGFHSRQFSPWRISCPICHSLPSSPHFLRCTQVPTVHRAGVLPQDHLLAHILTDPASPRVQVARGAQSCPNSAEDRSVCSDGTQCPCCTRTLHGSCQFTSLQVCTFQFGSLRSQLTFHVLCGVAGQRKSCPAEPLGRDGEGTRVPCLADQGC